MYLIWDTDGDEAYSYAVILGFSGHQEYVNSNEPFKKPRAPRKLFLTGLPVCQDMMSSMCWVVVYKVMYGFKF